MKDNTRNVAATNCALCEMNRRRFIGRCALAAGAAGFLTGPVLSAAGERPKSKRIRIVYSLHAVKQPGPDWPNKGFDFAPVIERINQTLKRQCPQLTFITSLANGPEEAKKIVDEDAKTNGVDGYIVYQMNCWNRVVQTIAATGKPVLYADFQFGGSGGFLVYTAAFLRENTPNVGFVASSRISDFVEAVKCFEHVGPGANFAQAVAETRVRRTRKAGNLRCRPDPVSCLSAEECLRQLKQAKILAVRGQESGPAGEILGIPIVHVPFAELNDAWKAADRDEARAWADAWQKTARKIEGVSRETLEQSAAMYLAEKALLKKYGANAITINCLGGFYGGHIHAYPCLGFYQLCNEGLIGGCECDVRSAASMVLFTTLTRGRPGYISDPVMDTSKRQIIYAHCVASNRVFGPEGPTNPIEILTHSEDRQGASVRSLLPIGYMTTTIQLDQNRKEILLHRAKAVANDPDDRACRTKLCAEPVGDFEKLFTLWDRWG
ncbi:MAG: twin-arginine translocation signal domain-containing protein, partial [Verrucomicrobiae bacterium]|nr:twin-arginine translocation signal domain-containing protein [Verrucomicrobiae bacterium]